MTDLRESPSVTESVTDDDHANYGASEKQLKAYYRKVRYWAFQYRMNAVMHRLCDWIYQILFERQRS